MAAEKSNETLEHSNFFRFSAVNEACCLELGLELDLDPWSIPIPSERCMSLLATTMAKDDVQHPAETGLQKIINFIPYTSYLKEGICTLKEINIYFLWLL